LANLVQEVWVKIIANIGKADEFKDLIGYYAWVKEIATNLCFTAHRKDKYLSAENTEDVSENSNSCFTCPSNDDEILMLEVKEILRAQSDPLTVDIFILVIEQEFTVLEAADLLGCSRPTVYRHLEKVARILAPYRLTEKR
jgi:DNA-directed RNA polymerase specialized sigma24 family protein